MSQHHFTTEKEDKVIYVLMGWDRPCQGYFMVIQDLTNEEMLYTNLANTNPHPQTLDTYLKFLQETNITIPKNMLEQLKSDRELNAGNVSYDWNNM